jgi:NAD(P)-dependent dehydrogenase (short-subunit alcohol dehydrogenase family)
MNVNLLGPFLLCKHLGAQMLAKGRGSIVNVASVAGLAAVSHRSAYNASKHGLIGLTKTLAAEWGGRGVRVNASVPGWIKTEMDVADQGTGAYSDDRHRQSCTHGAIRTRRRCGRGYRILVADGERAASSTA